MIQARACARSGHWRDLLDVCLDRWDRCGPWYDALAGDEEFEVFFSDPRERAKWRSMKAWGRAQWLVEQLWGCTNVLSADKCSVFDLPLGSTYAQLVRKLVKDLAG